VDWNLCHVCGEVKDDVDERRVQTGMDTKSEGILFRPLPSRLQNPSKPCVVVTRITTSMRSVTHSCSASVKVTTISSSKSRTSSLMHLRVQKGQS
jgi:hypothetical protein